MFGWVEAYTTFSMSDFTKVRDVLSASGIKYRFKSRNMLGDMRGRVGTFGVNMDYATQYYLFVKKADSENVQHLLRKALHG